MAFFFHAFYPVNDRIFRNRLEQHRDHQQFFRIDILVNIKVVADPLPKTELLDLHPCLSIFKFSCQRDQCGLSIAEDITQCPRKQQDRISDPRFLAAHCLHAYSLQRIIQEVRVDLAGQHFELHFLFIADQFFFPQFSQIPGLFSFFDPADHYLQILVNICQLIIARYAFHYPEIPAACLVHRLLETADPLPRAPGKSQDDPQRHKYGRKQDDHILYRHVRQLFSSLSVTDHHIEFFIRLIGGQRRNTDKSFFPAPFLPPKVIEVPPVKPVGKDHLFIPVGKAGRKETRS